MIASFLDPASKWGALIAAATGVALVWYETPRWLEHRRRPDLSLSVIQVHAPINNVAGFTLQMKNSGRGTARHWKAEIRSPRQGPQITRPTGTMQPARSLNQFEDEALSGGRDWVVEWRAAAEGDVIAPDQHHDVNLQVVGLSSGQESASSFAITAEKMRTTLGVIRAYQTDGDVRITIEGERRLQ